VTVTSAPPPDALALAIVTDAPIFPSIEKSPSFFSPWSLSTFPLFLDLPFKDFSIVIIPSEGGQANHAHGKFSCPDTDTDAPVAEADIQLLTDDRGHASKEKILPGSAGEASVKQPALENPTPDGCGAWRRRPATWKPLVAFARFPTSTPCCNSVGSLAAKQQTRDATETSARMFEKRQ